MTRVEAKQFFKLIRTTMISRHGKWTDHSGGTVAEPRANMVRVDSDFSATPFKAKISNAEPLRVHTMLVIGGHDMESGAVSVRLHHGGPQRAKPRAEVVADVLASIKDAKGINCL